MTQKKVTVTDKHTIEAMKELAPQLANRAIEIALAEQSTEQYITAEEARAMGAGKAEWFDDAFNQWNLCTPDICNYHPYFKYRAIKQPEPVHPHAELKAMYEQQVKDGMTEFYVWEFLYLKTNEWRVIPTEEPPQFINPVQYRCTPKPTCQVQNLDTGELKTMTREAAKKLQAETKDVCDWFTTRGALVIIDLNFGDASIYTYKLKAQSKQVSWTGSREDVLALLKEWRVI